MRTILESKKAKLFYTKTWGYHVLDKIKRREHSFKQNENEARKFYKKLNS